MAKKPEATIKVGKVQIVVWKNSGEKYDTLAFAMTKNYKKDNEWKTTSSFTMADLADAQIAIAEAQRRFRLVVKTNSDSGGDEPAY
jgi:hypothetical protein